MVLEDLRPKGYTVQNRFNGVNKEHCKIFLSKLAKFHAASAVYFDKHEELKYNRKSAFSREYSKVMLDFINGRMKYFVKAVEGNANLRHLADKIANWESKSFNELARIVEPDPDRFNVLNHGDAWVNNYLFSHDETEQPNDILFIDYQISHWGSPAIDILYFYVSSTDNDLDESEYDNFIHFYHAKLVNNLHKLVYKREIPSLKQLHMDLLKNGFYASFHCFMALSVILLKPRSDANFETMFSNDESADDLKKATYENPVYMKRLEKLLLFLDKKGLLEISS